MSFSVIVLVAALWALSTEMVEDSLVDLIYGHIYGWRVLTYALVTASLALTSISTILLYYGSGILIQNLDLVRKTSAIVLGLIGLFWLVSSIAARGRESELEEAKRASQVHSSEKKNYLIALQLVVIEELEILLILIPLVIAAHALEASIAGGIGVTASVSTALVFRRRFERIVAGRMAVLKVISGTFLIALGLVLFVEV